MLPVILEQMELTATPGPLGLRDQLVVPDHRVLSEPSVKWVRRGSLDQGEVPVPPVKQDSLDLQGLLGVRDLAGTPAAAGLQAARVHPVPRGSRELPVLQEWWVLPVTRDVLVLRVSWETPGVRVSREPQGFRGKRDLLVGQGRLGAPVRKGSQGLQAARGILEPQGPLVRQGQ